MAGVVGEVDAGDQAGEGAGEQVDGQRVAVHLGEERDDEGGEAAERAPVTPRLRVVEADREDDKQQRVEDDESPEPVAVVAHRQPLPTGVCSSASRSSILRSSSSRWRRSASSDVPELELVWPWQPLAMPCV